MHEHHYLNNCDSRASSVCHKCNCETRVIQGRSPVHMSNLENVAAWFILLHILVPLTLIAHRDAQ